MNEDTGSVRRGECPASPALAGAMANRVSSYADLLDNEHRPLLVPLYLLQAAQRRLLAFMCGILLRMRQRAQSDRVY